MSNKIALMLEEQILKVFGDDDTLVLTTKRVRYNSVVWGNSKLISITLDSVASCGLITTSSPFLLILAAIAGIASFMQNTYPTWVFILTAVVLIIAYGSTRKSSISIASNGGQVILMPITGVKREAAVDFIEAVEWDKLNVMNK